MSGSESEGQAVEGNLKVWHALVSGEESGGNHCNWARKCRLKERARNGGVYTSGDDGKLRVGNSCVEGREVKLF